MQSFDKKVKDKWYASEVKEKVALFIKLISKYEIK